MPAYLTHKLAAQAACDKIDDPKIKSIISNNMTDYFAGAQSTDFVYFYHWYLLPIGYKTAIYGWLTHRARPAEYNAKAAVYLKENYSDALAAYIFGVLTHYYVDMYLHAQVSKDTKNLSEHTMIEQALDVVYADSFGIDANDVALSDELLNILRNASEKEIDAYHTTMARNVYDGYKLRPGVFRRGYRWWFYLSRLVDKRPSAFRKFWLRILNVFLSFNLYAQINPPLEKAAEYDLKKYFDLLDIATDASVAHMKLVMQYLRSERHVSVLQSLPNVSAMGVPVPIPYEVRKAFKKAYKKVRIKK